jgi:hypothetical protein
MDFQSERARQPRLRGLSGLPSGGSAEISGAGLPRGVCEALADPIVQALMTADRVDPKTVEELVRRMAARLAADRGGGGVSHAHIRPGDRLPGRPGRRTT